VRIFGIFGKDSAILHGRYAGVVVDKGYRLGSYRPRYGVPAPAGLHTSKLDATSSKPEIA
jgi:hypothetical protein